MAERVFDKIEESPKSKNGKNLESELA